MRTKYDFQTTCEHLLHIFVAKADTHLAMNEAHLVAIESRAPVIDSKPSLEPVTLNETKDLSSSRQGGPTFINCVFFFESGAAHSCSQ
jgi:hypothetical protein